MPTGETLFWENTASPIRDAEGRIISFVELTRDITDRIQTEDELERLRIVQQSILDNIPDMAWVKDKERRFIAVNNALAASTGVPIQEMIGKTDLDYYPKDIAEAYMADDLQVIHTEQRKTVEEPFIGATKELVWIETVKTPLHNEKKEVIGTTGIARDITKRKQIEEQLRESETRFRELADLLPVIAFESDLKGKLTYVNNLAFDLFGYTREEFMGRPIFDYIAPEDRERSISNARRVMAGEYLGNNEYTAVRKDGSRLAALIQTAPMKNNRGELIGSRGVLVDISRQKQIEDELRESESKFRALFEQSQESIILLDSQGKVIYSNPAHEQLTGIKREDFLGKFIWEHPERVYIDDHGMVTSREKYDAELQRLVATKQSPLLNRLTEIEMKTGDGDVHICLSSVILIEMENDFMIGLIATDITEGKKIREALQESEEKYRSLVQNMKLGIFRTTPDAGGKILETNKACEEITGYSRNELLNMAVKDLYSDPEDRSRFVEQISSAFGKANFETSFKKRDGSQISVSITAKPIEDKTGKIVYIDGILEDITERLNIERALEESEEKYHSLVENIKLGIFRTLPGGKGKLVEVNKAMEELSGYSRDELLNLEVVNLYPSLEERKEFIHQLTLSPEKATLTSHLQRKDGTQIAIFMIAKAIKDKTGRLLFVDGTIEDITERKKMEERIIDLYQMEKKQRQELEEEAKARGMFIDVLAHELRTPLTPILVSTGIFSELLGNEKGVRGKLAANLYTSTKVLTTRLEELLEVARYSRGTFKLEKQPVDTIKYLNEAISHFKPSLDQRGQSLIIEIAGDLPVAEIDRSRLEQVIINLLSNASKFSPEKGNISFRARKQNDEILVEVQDEGIGISPEESKRIFQPYHRVEQDRLKFPGLGLGLAVAKQIVEAHGGQIWVISKPEQGSTFCFTVPVKKN
jgi:PAS domain S-box-containing protein